MPGSIRKEKHRFLQLTKIINFLCVPPVVGSEQTSDRMIVSTDQQAFSVTIMVKVRNHQKPLIALQSIYQLIWLYIVCVKRKVYLNMLSTFCLLSFWNPLCLIFNKNFGIHTNPSKMSHIMKREANDWYIVENEHWTQCISFVNWHFTCFIFFYFCELAILHTEYSISISPQTTTDNLPWIRIWIIQINSNLNFNSIFLHLMMVIKSRYAWQEQ